MMKKVVVIVLFTLFVATLFSSCKSTDCPAYEQHATVSTS